MSKLYIERVVRVGDEEIAESELLRRSRLIVVLAEPGAGKTDLLAHLAGMLATESVRATRFRSPFHTPHVGSVVVDAMDEVARIGDAALNDIIIKASGQFSGTAIFASRSGEWETARTKFVEECFGQEATVAHLKAFNWTEQKCLFDDRFPGEDFEAFGTEADRFDLTPLLGNPEFLQLFGLAYLENERKFTSKSQIYADAAKRLAHESNDGRMARDRPDSALIVKQCGTVFARLLLSGASGVSRKEKLGDRDYPYVGVIGAEVPTGIDHLLDSKLFKPASDANKHEPVHRIVAEYLAARYLVDRIGNAGDRLSLKRCLAVIAPNRVVRDELRGLLGWMAALGNDQLQKATIALDPYAVLANGDPAQLSTPNKILLIEFLRDLASTDPYFRRADAWRSFNVGQFFSEETVDAIRPILASRSQTHLLGLVLDLIKGTPAVVKLSDELETLAFDASADDHERVAAFDLLLEQENYDGQTAFDGLLPENSAISLQLLSNLLLARGFEPFGYEKVTSVLRRLTTLYPDRRGRARHDGMTRYFIKRFLKEFPADGVAKYIDELTTDIHCTCEAKDYACECRNGISKIVGGLLDRYFETAPGPHDPERLWRWLRDLRYSRPITSDESCAVSVLRSDNHLRQAVQRAAFAGTSTLEQCKEIEHRFYVGKTHAGIIFHIDDVAVMVEHAVDTDNHALWEAMWRNHHPDRQPKGPDPLRARMREQARADTSLLKIWARRDHAAKEWWRKHRADWSTRNKRWAQREAEARARTFDHLRENRSRIEAGEDWWWLQTFARCLILEPDKFGEVVDTVETAHKALRSCFSFVTPHIPTLHQLGVRDGTATAVAMVLHAACLLRFRETGSLEGIDVNALKAVKTEASRSSGVPDVEADAFDAELDRILFADKTEIELFVRQYIEPSFSGAPDSYTEVGRLRHKPLFQHLQQTLPLEWLQRFPEMPIQAETSLFEMASQHSPREAMQQIVADRCARYPSDPTDSADISGLRRRNYWLLNAFFFCDDKKLWEAFRAKDDSVLSIASHIERFSGGNEDIVPAISADKIYDILDGFVDIWPAVELPSTHGTSSPKGERAYRFLREIPWRINRDTPDKSLPVLDRLIGDARFEGFRSDLFAIRSSAVRKLALQDFRAPMPEEISALLEQRAIVSVEVMRALMAEALADVEAIIRHSETDTLDTFYSGGKRVDENTARNRIVEHLRAYMTAHGLSVQIEHHMSGGNRCDITVSAMVGGGRKLLTIEVKGQWHAELFTAASAQLHERYSSNPDAEQQGIYLVLWFGPPEKVAGLKNVTYASAESLCDAIVAAMPAELRARVDVQMMDLSRDAVSRAKGPKGSTSSAPKKRA